MPFGIDTTPRAVVLIPDTPLEVLLDGIVSGRVVRGVTAHGCAWRNDLAATAAHFARFGLAVAQQLLETKRLDRRFLQTQPTTAARRLHARHAVAILLANLVDILGSARWPPGEALARKRHRERRHAPCADLVHGEVGCGVSHGEDRDDIGTRLQPRGDSKLAERAEAEPQLLLMSPCISTPRNAARSRVLLDEPLVVGDTRQPHFWWQILRPRWR
eukprot:scaffold23181_cov48-Phaeocystis_antarctica.AAC.3